MKKTLDLTHLNAEYTRKLNEIAENCKKEYTEFVDKYSRKYGSHHLWWALPFSSRNIYLDETFQNICYLHLCRWAIHNDGVDCIILANRALRDVLLINYKPELEKRRITLEYQAKGFRLYAILIGMIRSFKTELKEFILIKKYSIRKKYKTEGTITLIDTPVLSSSFESGKYEDRYFNDIQEYVKYNIFFLPSLIKNSSVSWKKFTECVEKSTDYRFFLKQNVVKLIDFFDILKYFFFCFCLSFRKYTYGDVDVTPLIKDSLLRGCSCAPSLKGILDYQFIRRLSKSDIRIECLISWYEGRPSEIMMQKAFRKFYPGDKCVGYIGIPHSELALSQYISEEQYKQEAAPLKMTVPGMIYEKQVKQFCKKVNLIRVPILRNSYVCKNNKAFAIQNRKIIVILPFFEEYAQNMLHILNEYVKMHPEFSHNVMIKNHPVHIDKTVEYYLKEKLCFSPKYVSGELVECMKDVDLAYISYSSASLEVLSQGKFLVNLCPAGKLRNTAVPDDMDANLYRIVYNEEETFEAFDSILTGGTGKIPEINVMDVLESVNTETVSRMWS